MKRSKPTRSIPSAAGQSHPSASGQPLSIVRRKYLSEAQTRGGGDVSVRIEHEGQHAFFPLFTDQIEPAHEPAASILRTISAAGWGAAQAKYVREFTLAVFWLPNPLTCTYTSLFTALQPPKSAAKTAANRVRVAVLEPETPFRWGLVQWLDGIPGYQCVEAHADAESLLRAIPRAAPDLVLYNAPPCTPKSTQLQARLAAEFPAQIAFPFGIYSDSEHAWYCVTGVDGGYYYRRRRPEQMLQPISGLWQGPPPSRESVESQLRHHIQTLFGLSAEAVDAFPALTQRERDVLLGLRRGHTDKSLATLLGVSVWTVHTHMKSIFEKLGVHTRAEAVARFFEK